MILLFLACAGDKGDSAVPEDTSFEYPYDDVLTLAHAQAKGTHNSYHVANEATIDEWDYTHLPLDQQAGEQGVRQFELDVHRDPDTGEITVYHVDTVDALSTCAALAACLGVLREWSDANPAHLPLVVLIEPKTEVESTSALEHLDEVDAIIRASWPADRLLTPEEMQGSYPTLREAVVAEGWPTLGETRGALILGLMDNDGAVDLYTDGRTSLAGRAMFPLVDPADSMAALVKLDDPIAQGEEIAAAVQEGLLVRTRADTSREDAAANDTAGLEAALASGAHFLSTDFPGPVEGFDYVVEIPGGAPARCNPLTAPAECSAEALEDPTFLD